MFERFWRDPDFPLVQHDDVARRAVFEALGDGWQLVDDAGAALGVESPDQLAVNSRSQWLQLASREEDGGQEADDEDADTSAGGGGRAGGDGGGGRSGGGSSDDPARYLLHRMKVDNAALTNRETRTKLYHLLSDLAEALDPSSRLDLQLLSFSVEVNAAEGSLTKVEDAAGKADVVWQERSEDFLA